MSLDADYIVDRRRMRRKLTFWRIFAVALAVIDRGVDAARVRAIGWGEQYPVADSDTDENRKRNRRVEITVSTGDAAVPVRVVNAP